VDLASTGLDHLFAPGRRFEAFAPTPDTFVPREQLRAVLFLERSPASRLLAR
jgi:hypothetical protein